MKKNELLFNQSNLANSERIGVSQDMRDLFAISFTMYKISENYKLIYRNDPTCAIPKRLIELYTKHIKPDYNSMIYSFKRKYISNELLVEKNDTKEQREGLKNVYDYIQKYDINKGLDIFISTLEINSLLWGPTDNKNNKEIIKEENKIRNEIAKLKEESKTERNLAKFKKARELEKELSGLTHKIKIGGRLRSNNYEDEVKLFDTEISVPSASESLNFMNSFINKEKKEEFEEKLKDENIINYITYCVKEITELIYYQPFQDGNKRTFRALLNLMFKARGIPPVYIKNTEREEYKSALLKAMKDKNYAEITGFYLFKICDSIYELDVLPYKQKRLKDYSKEEVYGKVGDINKINNKKR